MNLRVVIGIPALRPAVDRSWTVGTVAHQDPLSGPIPAPPTTTPMSVAGWGIVSTAWILVSRTSGEGCAGDGVAAGEAGAVGG
jgi:hypothetical protein